EIEQAQLSVIDIMPQDTRGYLAASRAMKEAGKLDRAVAFCKQAALLDPNSPFPYADAMVCAEISKDTKTMEWAAGNILARDWPDDNLDLHNKASQKLNALGTILQSDHRPQDAERMARAVSNQRQRDIVVELSWNGEADLDLEMKEPIGTVCSFQQRQTPGGGILVGDSLLSRSRETYTAAKAFAGDYEIIVRRIWGQPLGSKATLKITLHQGTPKETVRQETFVFDRTHSTKVVLSDGRRTSVAHVSPQGTQRPKTQTVKTQTSGDIYNKLRAIADPEITPVNTGMRGGMASSGIPVEPRMPTWEIPKGMPREQITLETRAASNPNNMDLATQAVVLPDKQGIGLKVTPIFQTASRTQSSPYVNLPLIPGGQNPGQ
ncbi:MAG TPA: hypothetical protein VGY77_07450, partial [Gemmataceae bacterium]|nr:hypothetical protein [Gemmataceae bacterium]